MSKAWFRWKLDWMLHPTGTGRQTPARTTPIVSGTTASRVAAPCARRARFAAVIAAVYAHLPTSAGPSNAEGQGTAPAGRMNAQPKTGEAGPSCAATGAWVGACAYTALKVRVNGSSAPASPFPRCSCAACATHRPAMKTASAPLVAATATRRDCVSRDPRAAATARSRSAAATQRPTTTAV